MVHNAAFGAVRASNLLNLVRLSVVCNEIAFALRAPRQKTSVANAAASTGDDQSVARHINEANKESEEMRGDG